MTSPSSVLLSDLKLKIFRGFLPSWPQAARIRIQPSQPTVVTYLKVPIGIQWRNVFFNTEILVFLKYYAVFNIIIFLVSLFLKGPQLVLSSVLGRYETVWLETFIIVTWFSLVLCKFCLFYQLIDVLSCQIFSIFWLYPCAKSLV